MSRNDMAGRLEGHDIEEYTQIVNPWDVILRQTSAGRFHGRLDYVHVNGIVIYRECWSQRVLASGATPPDYFMFGATLVPEKHTDWCGQPLGPEILAFGNSGTETEFATPKDSIHAVLLVPDHLMRSYFGEETVEAALASQWHHLGGIGQGPSQLILTINHIIGKYLARPERLADAREVQTTETQLLAAVARIFPQVTAETRRPGPRPRREALHRAIGICEQLKRPVTVPELAALADASRRTLERAFQETLGISPRKYLRRRLMQASRHELMDEDPRSTRVTDVATRWGFSELGRFAVDYKRQFGESPSYTLKKRGHTTPRRLIDIIS